MERLKTLDEMGKPDPRITHFATYDEKIKGYRPFRIQDIYNTARQHNINNAAPEEIRTSFAVAQNMYAYSWFYYPLNAEAGFLALRTAERALKLRMGMAKERIGLSALVKKAVDQGLLKEDGYSIPGPDPEYANMIEEITGKRPRPVRSSFLERLPKMLSGMRNSPAHGEVSIHPMGALRLRISAETINQLYPGGDNEN